MEQYEVYAESSLRLARMGYLEARRQVSLNRRASPSTLIIYGLV